MEETKKCPKCGGSMEEGYTAGDGNRWFVKDDLIGLFVKAALTGRETISFRCKSCGYLESYTK